MLLLGMLSSLVGRKYIQAILLQYLLVSAILPRESAKSLCILRPFPKDSFLQG